MFASPLEQDCSDQTTVLWDDPHCLEFMINTRTTTIRQQQQESPQQQQQQQQQQRQSCNYVYNRNIVDKEGHSLHKNQCYQESRVFLCNRYKKRHQVEPLICNTIQAAIFDLFNTLGTLQTFHHESAMAISRRCDLNRGFGWFAALRLHVVFNGLYM